MRFEHPQLLWLLLVVPPALMLFFWWPIARGKNVLSNSSRRGCCRR